MEQLVAWSLEQRTKSKPENAIYLFLMVLSNNSGPLAFYKIEIEKKMKKIEIEKNRTNNYLVNTKIYMSWFLV